MCGLSLRSIQQADEKEYDINAMFSNKPLGLILHELNKKEGSTIVAFTSCAQM